MSAWTYMYMYIYITTNIHMHINIDIYIQRHMHIHTCIHTYTDKTVHIRICIHVPLPQFRSRCNGCLRQTDRPPSHPTCCFLDVVCSSENSHVKRTGPQRPTTRRLYMKVGPFNITGPSSAPMKTSRLDCLGADARSKEAQT